MKTRHISISGMRSTVAFLLVLWCAGTGCLAHGMVAASGATANIGTPAKVNLKQPEMAMSGHACCKARHRVLGKKLIASPETEDWAETITLPEDSTPDAGNSCCPLTSGSFVIASRSHTASDNDISVLFERGFHDSSCIIQFSTQRAVPLRLPNHEHTYLTCCAFLI